MCNNANTMARLFSSRGPLDMATQGYTVNGNKVVGADAQQPIHFFQFEIQSIPLPCMLLVADEGACWHHWGAWSRARAGRHPRYS
eukprot:4032137-Amphidinium_carterae.1